jgi:hypothetical protein
MKDEFVIQDAKRELIWVKVALMSPSGGGKTYSALRLATGMQEKMKELGQDTNIIMFNTEVARGRYYANEFKYKIVDVGAPHEPEKYVRAIQYGVDQGFKIIILDSTSFEWEGDGGCLDIHQREGGTFQAWAKVTPRHNKFIQAIADSQCHIIATMRGKDQYEIDKDEKGKSNVKKLGVGAQQRSGFEYEFSTTFLLDQKSNFATNQKDNTHLFETLGDVKLTEDHGRKLIEWANSGEGYTIPIRNMKNITEDMQEKKDLIIQLCKDLGGAKNETLMTTVKKYATNGNPNKITNVEDLDKLYAELNALKTPDQEGAK